MQWKTHTAIGIAAAMAALRPSPSVALMAAAGSLIVDMDIKTSKASKIGNMISKIAFWGIIAMAAADKFFETSFLMSAASTAVNFAAAIAAAAVWILIKEGSSHRGFTHSIAGMVISCFAAGIVFDTKYTAAFAIGYGCHIIADLFNKKGCQLLFPNKKRYCLRMCRSNGTVNTALFFVFSGISLFEVIFFITQNFKA